MKHLLILILLLILLLSVSCENPVDTTTTHPLVGEWVAGNYITTFNKDYTYTEEKDTVLLDEGNWNTVEDTLVLYTDVTIKLQYQISNDTLYTVYGSSTYIHVRSSSHEES